MDDYGFTGALRVALRVFSGAGRRSGRTTRMIKGLHEGSLVVVTARARSAPTLARIKELRPDLVDFSVMAIEPTFSDLSRAVESWRNRRARGTGRVVLSHVLIEEMLSAHLDTFGRNITAITGEPIVPSAVEMADPNAVRPVTAYDWDRF